MIPAVYSTSPSPKVSERYRFVPTHEYVSELENQGWQLESAKAPKARKSDPQFGLHAVTFRRQWDAAGTESLGGLTPRIHLLNSHNGTSQTKIILGIFRLVCSNGLMVSSGQISEISFRHDRSAKDTATVLGELFKSDAMASIETARRWDSVSLTWEQQVDFAEKAKVLRFGDKSNVYAGSLLDPRRVADQGDSLWKTFNRVQENILGGGVRFSGMRRRARAITNISKEVELNQSLWQLAESYATA